MVWLLSPLTLADSARCSAASRSPASAAAMGGRPDRAAQRARLAVAAAARAAADGAHARAGGAARERRGGPARLEVEHRPARVVLRGRARRSRSAMTIVNTAATGALAIDDDGFWYHNVVERNARRTAPAANSSKPGLLLLEIDGLAHEVLCGRCATATPHDGPLAAGGLPPAHPLGDGLVLPDGRLPGRAAARRQRGHARLPLVGEGPRPADRHQPSPRCRGARAPSLRRARPAVLRRRQPREHPLGRRSPQPADDEHGAAAATATGASARTTSPTSPTPTTSLARSCWSMREVSASVARLPAAPPGRATARSPRSRTYALVRAWATIIQRDLQVASVIADMYAGPAGDLHDLPGL